MYEAGSRYFSAAIVFCGAIFLAEPAVAACSAELFALGEALGQPTHTGAFRESLANSTMARIALTRCQDRERESKAAAEAAQRQAMEIRALAEQQLAIERNEIDREAMERASHLALERQKQSIISTVSEAILDGRCNDAKDIALRANNIDLAEQTIRICKTQSISNPHISNMSDNKKNSGSNICAPPKTSKQKIMYNELISRGTTSAQAACMASN